MNAVTILRVATAVGMCALLSACTSSGPVLSIADLTYSTNDRGTTPAGPGDDPRLFPDDSAATAPATIDSGPHLECVPYAREHSGVDIHGDAYTWWDKASGHYARGATPLLGAVMVMVGYAGKHRAHVAVVTRMVSPREIRINHANWLNDGAIYVNDPVQDVSAENDWSQVKVWNIRSGSWGTKVYNVRGFIGPGADGDAIVAFNNFARQGTDPIARQIAASSVVLPTPAAAARGDDNLLNDPGRDR